MRYLLTALVATAVVAIAPASASADMADCSKKLESNYSWLYHQVAKKHGKRAPGRNIRKNGVLFRSVKFHATCGEIRRSKGQLKQLYREPTWPTILRTAVPPAQPPAGVQTAGQTGAYNGWAIPEYIVQCESGGNYEAQNPSGAYGAYQIMPGTSSAYGCDMSTHQGQDNCAAEIYAKQGAGPWSCG